MNKIAALRPIYKIGISLCISCLVLLIILNYEMMALTRVMIGWDVFALIYLILCWVTFYNTLVPGIQKIATSQDKGHVIIFGVLVCSTIVSLFTILLLLRDRGEAGLSKELVEVIYFLGVFFSWMLLHALYTFHYAHLYYRDMGKVSKKNAPLIFPDDSQPDYLDFAYFSYIIGMTFQVSDVTVASKKLRKTVLIHSLISFIFNVVIIALCVNAIVSV